MSPRPSSTDAWVRTRIACTGASGVPTSATGSGGRCARTTARPAKRGTTFPLTSPTSVPIAGAKTASSGSRDDNQHLCFALSFWNGERPIAQRAPLRPLGHARQSRRGRQGVLFLPRQPAVARVHARALQVSARAHFRTRISIETNRRRSRFESEYELIDTGIFDAERLLRRRDRVRQSRSRRYAHPHPRYQPRRTGARLARAADALVSQRVVVARTASSAPRSSCVTMCAGPTRWSRIKPISASTGSTARTPTSCSSPRTRRTSSALSACRIAHRA